MPAPVTTPEFLALLRKSGLHPPEVLDKLLREAGLPDDDPPKAAAALIKQGVITSFQAKLLLSGRYRGFRLGPYIVREQIGQGGMGTVYLAEHETLRRRVAIKVLSPGEGDNRVAVERFLREARAAAALDHPNIVRTFDVGKHGATHYLVMEYVEGKTLDKLMEEGGPLPAARAVDFITQAAAGLQHAYERGFIHRDIKPANLMIAKGGVIKILDMGLARSAEPADQLTAVLDKGAVVGTADYIAPEQATNCPNLDIRADIYSLGATFFTLVAGRTPFQGSTTQKLIHHQMTEAPSLSGVDRTFPVGLSAVAAKMLAKRPEDRYQTPADVVTALAGWLPADSKAAAGLSRADLQKSKSLQPTLSEVVGTTKPLPHVDPVAPAAPAARRSGGRTKLLIAGGLLALLIVGGGAAAVVLGGLLKRGDAAAVTAPTPSPAPPTSTGKALPPPAPPDAPPGARLAYELDLSAQKPFLEVGHQEIPDPSKSNMKKWVSSMQSGEGKPPPGWSGKVNLVGPESEWSASTVAGRTALGGRTIKGTPDFVLSASDAWVPSGRCRVKFDYRTEGTSAPVTLRARVTKPSGRPPFDVTQLQPTNGAWASFETDIDLKGAYGVGFDLVPRPAAEPTAWVGVSSFAVWDLLPPPEPVVFKYDPDGQEPFFVRMSSAEGGDPQRPRVAARSGGQPPAGWAFRFDQPGCVGEFFADTGSGGRPGLGLRMTTGRGNTVLASPVLADLPARLRLRFLYQTSPNAGLTVRFRPADGKGSAVEVGKFSAQNAGWRLGTLDIDVPEPRKGSIEFVGTTYPGFIRLREVYAHPAPYQGPLSIRLDFAAVPDLKATVATKKPVPVELDALPPGVKPAVTKDGAEVEFAVQSVKGDRALGITNLNNQKGGQWAFEPEGLGDYRLEAGRRYKAVVSYLVQPGGAGSAQALEDKKQLGRAVLDATADWKTTEVQFNRPDAAPARIVIESTNAGPNSTVYVRSIVVQLVD